MRKLVFMLAILLAARVYAQDTTDFVPGSKAELADQEDPDAKWKLGIKVGASMDKVYGGEFARPVYKLGQAGAVTLTWRKYERFRYQQQLGFSIRGSKFNTQQQADYNKLVFNYVDYAHLAQISLYKDNLWLTAGAQFSFLIKSVLYNEETAPGQQLYPKTLAENLPLRRYDAYGVGGLTFLPGRIGFQFLVKYGLLDLNEGLNYPNPDYPLVKPALNTGLPVKTISFELGMVF